jgi:hypothetical protein
LLANSFVLTLNTYFLYSLFDLTDWFVYLAVAITTYQDIVSKRTGQATHIMSGHTIRQITLGTRVHAECNYKIGIERRIN